MNVNPTAIAFWVSCTAIGYLYCGAGGAAAGLALSSAISFLFSVK